MIWHLSLSCESRAALKAILECSRVPDVANSTLYTGHRGLARTYWVVGPRLVFTRPQAQKLDSPHKAAAHVRRPSGYVITKP